MSFDLAFVDRISASPTTRLDLKSASLDATADVTDFGMPELTKARSRTLMLDGERISGSAYGNRLLTIRLRLPGTDSVADYDAAAAALQNVSRELNRETNFLRYRAGTTKAVFFQTYRSDYNRIEWDGSNRFATIVVEAWSYGIGEKETLPAVTVYNDPAEGTTLNANPFFETDVSGWTATGGALVRTTSQFHEGSASGQFTPDGVTASPIVTSTATTDASPGQVFRASGWLRCAVARTLTLQLRWRDASNVFLSASVASIAVSANTWTYFDVTGTAPASTAFVKIAMEMSSTPAASNVVFLDELRLRQPGTAGAMYFDVTDVQGDVDTPLFLAFGSSLFSQINVDRRTLLAARRRGTPSAMVLPLQAEAMTLGTDTTLPGADSTASGSGSNYARVATWSNANLITRLTAATWPANPGEDLRGQYRVFVRHRGSPAGAGGAQMRLLWGPNATANMTTNPTATAHADASSTRWAWADLGTVQFPQGNDPETDGLSGVPLAPAGMRFEVQVSKASAAQVDIDYLIFIPADDLLFTLTIPSGGAGTTAIVVDPLKAMAYNVGASGEVRSDRMVSARGGLPYARPGVTNRWWMLVDINGQANANINGDQLTDAHTITPSYYPLYLGVARPVDS